MSTLILRLAAPMQSWGSDSKYCIRKTNREPTKSGIIGLLASALGCPRDNIEEFENLNKLKFGVRTDQDGRVICDFQIVQGKKTKDTNLTYRYYLCDAVFTAGLEGPDEDLKRLEEALNHPAFPLYLGRRSCPPTGKLCLGIRNLPLKEALMNEPFKSSKPQTNEQLRIVLDDNSGSKQVMDVPVSFSPFNRQYKYRNISEIWINNPNNRNPEHDPMSEL